MVDVVGGGGFFQGRGGAVEGAWLAVLVELCGEGGFHSVIIKGLIKLGGGYQVSIGELVDYGGRVLTGFV